LVREGNVWCQSRGVGTINVGSDVLPGQQRVGALYVNRLHERIEVAWMWFERVGRLQHHDGPTCRLVVGILPINHATSPFNRAWGGRVDARWP
jgi:hypothetical protein